MYNCVFPATEWGPGNIIITSTLPLALLRYYLLLPPTKHNSIKNTETLHVCSGSGVVARILAPGGTRSPQAWLRPRPPLRPRVAVEAYYSRTGVTWPGPGPGPDTETRREPCQKINSHPNTEKPSDIPIDSRISKDSKTRLKALSMLQWSFSLATIRLMNNHLDIDIKSNHQIYHLFQKIFQKMRPKTPSWKLFSFQMSVRWGSRTVFSIDRKSIVTWTVDTERLNKTQSTDEALSGN